jgi:hypothetical protein
VLAIVVVVARTIGLRVLPADENDLDRTQEGLSAYAFGRQASGLLPVDDDTGGPTMPTAPAGAQMKLVRAVVDHEDLDELRATLVKAGAVQIVVSEASLWSRRYVKSPEPARTGKSSTPRLRRPRAENRPPTINQLDAASNGGDARSTPRALAP